MKKFMYCLSIAFMCSLNSVAAEGENRHFAGNNETSIFTNAAKNIKKGLFHPLLTSVYSGVIVSGLYKSLEYSNFSFFAYWGLMGSILTGGAFVELGNSIHEELSKPEHNKLRCTTFALMIITFFVTNNVVDSYLSTT